MQLVTLIDNPMDPASWERVEVEDVRPFLVGRYAEWPAGARIYHGEVGQDHDVTPATPGDVERLAELDELTVVIFPEGPTALLIAIIVVAVVLTLALVFLLPSIPKTNNQTSSANNSLSQRSNQARPNARIPDIFGQVRSIPDLLAAPYRVYENHREIEIAYMCVGRGSYYVEDVRDGDTLISSIAGSSVAVYSPYSSPNNYATPQLQIGTAISDPVFDVRRLNDVNGQTMNAPNSNAVQADTEIKFKDGGIIEAAAGSGIDFTQYFTPGSTINIGNGDSTDLVSNASAIFAAATGVAPNKFVFATFDPSAHFAAGNLIRIDQAVFTWTDGTSSTGTGGGGGTISGSGSNTTYPWDDGGGHVIRTAEE